ncbi:S1C family serine protease [Lactobacillus mulieris]|uniref:Trypsin-like peptidase domain-containing protein n=1 Tax=Lactobacillus mulieris TaxID=2508708 RepID=A0AAW5WWC8_9LACO|nr:trypsin-like peptidase domain-containing protein [Lactobacillus mulieris]MCZ3621973.1 trypsin-like peptidase domain-containing protein [Lactobacillus mulieris]MCZ3623670.1 trypsin-like peptidase domain-containing protein [Lactobacillus mulieris]MCZ3635980.1 trypsin-like peptidase domain-containing protein [Lactobacillus mulieris]MCZ3689710.1 trypsin-like peptidase domain-containing protein [Lactobacillus mulieris]MCZ3695713.1 trypsin-like peptidase domain-containing protein [Lactobacillus m
MTEDKNQNIQNKSQNQASRSNLNTADKSQNKLLTKAAIVGVVAGLLGGGVSYVGLEQYSNYAGSSSAQTSISSSSASISKTSAKNSGTMTSAYNKVKGAVVSVINLKKNSTRKSNSIYDLFGGSDDDSSSSSSSSTTKYTTYSEGSGVIYLKSNGKGYIVTNNHVISGSDKVQVVLASGKTVDAKVVGKDSTSDLAVLSIDAKYVTQTASFGDSKSLITGQTVIAVGSPMGSEYASSVTQGIISAPSRTITTSSNQQTVIQTDAAINPGNSGGPLVNSAGQVIGINSMKLSQSTDGTSVEGMGFAIPSNEVVTIINQLVKNGKVTRPQLGIRVISLSELSSAYKEQLGIKTNLKSGIYVASVTKNSAASAAGMKSGDIITKVDGTSVSDVVSLHEILYKHKIGDKVTVTVDRNGKTVNLDVTLKSN